ncbi:unnamed protein product [Caenorhabditis brenneri]
MQGGKRTRAASEADLSAEHRDGPRTSQPELQVEKTSRNKVDIPHTPTFSAVMSQLDDIHNLHHHAWMVDTGHTQETHSAQVINEDLKEFMIALNVLNQFFEWKGRAEMKNGIPLLQSQIQMDAPAATTKYT